jgi:hypothetical protein
LGSPRWASGSGPAALAAWAILAGAVLLALQHARADAPAGHYVVEANGVRDTKTGLLWQEPLSTSTYPFNATANYCASLGIGWRVPTVKELLTLVDRGRYNPAIDTRYFPGPAHNVWSSSLLARNPSETEAWVVAFDSGSSSYSNTNVDFRVRCVNF